MTSIWAMTDVLDPRRDALLSLDEMVRGVLLTAARDWGLGGDAGVSLTVYDRIYRRRPQIGGHWTLFRAGLTRSAHEVSTVTVSLEFTGDRPTDLYVSGAEDVVAGGCTARALREALEHCGGPLRQVTPLVVAPAPVFGPSPLFVHELSAPPRSMN